VKFGRPIVAVDTVAVETLREQGLSWRAIASQIGIPKDTLRKSIQAV
jgi:hypothetical protein